MEQAPQSSAGQDGSSPPNAPAFARLALSIGLHAALVVITFAAFVPALLADFVSFDDPKFVTENPRIRALSTDNLRWMFTENSGGHWHPLTWLSWAVDYRLWDGLNPFGFHLTNVVLHAIGALLVYRIALRIIAIITEPTARRASPAVSAAAFFAAAMFAIHPLRVESVAWVTERRDVLSAALLFGAVLAYLKSVRPGHIAIASLGWTLATCLLLSLSLMAKAWGMSFFAIALIIDWYPLRRLPHSPLAWTQRTALRVFAQKAPFVLLGVGAAALAAWAQSSAFATKTIEEWGVFERFVQACYGLWFYVWKTIWPTGLAVMYELPIPLRASEGRFLAAYAGVALLAAFVVACRHRRPGVTAAAAVYVVMLTPVLGILQSGEQFVADRYSYLACVPLGILCAMGAIELLRTRRVIPPGAACAVGASILLVLGLLTFAQSTMWRNGLTLWQRAYQVTPTPLVRLNYAQELYYAERKAESASVLEALVRDAPAEGRAWFLLAEHYRDTGDAKRAEHAFRSAAASMPQAFMAHVNLGYLLLAQQGRAPEAIESFRSAVADVERGGRRVVHPGVYMALGDALRKTGDLAGARAAFTQALGFDQTRAMAEKELSTLGK